MKFKTLTKSLFFLFFLPFVLNAQYTIRGKVFSTENKEALPFVPVLIKGTTIGAQADFDGNYIIKTSKLGDSIVASYVGYKRLARAINKNLMEQDINFPLESIGGLSLDEVVVNAGDNPAHRIIRNCVKAKVKNDRNNLEAYEYETYNKLEFDLNRIPKEMREKKILKPIAFVFDNVDSSFSGEKPSLPFFIIENLSQFYYKKTPTRKKEVVIASKITGIENASVSQVLGDMYQNINIYDNNILVFNKQLPSPVSENALFYYKYYLEDSAFENNQYIYHIRFKPKRVQELSFSGNMWIADTTWGIKRLEMSLPKDANINFINSVGVIQEFSYTDSVWMLSKDRLVIDFAPTKKAIGFYGRKTTSYKKIKLNQPKDDKFYEFADKIIVEDGAMKKSDEFWAEHRHDSLTQRELKIFKMIDTIQSLPIYRTWVDVFYLVVAGYKKINNFEIGPYSNLVSYNKVEGLRLRFGGRTSEMFSKWYELNGFVAYGLLDEKFKYAIGFKSFLTKKPVRQIVGANYKSDYEILGQSTNGFSQDNVLASFFRTNPLTNLTRVDHAEGYYEREWFPGLITRGTIVGRKFTPLGSNKYLYVKRDGAIGEREYINNTEARINIRFGWKEKFVGEGFSRLSIGTHYPVLQLNYAKSLQNAFKGEYDYHKLVLNVSDRIRITPILGYTDYSIEGGKIWGAVPYPIMQLHGGNETYLYDYMAFNMMKYYEFASDQFISAALYHHFEGLFLNKVPLLRKLKWREVATIKTVWGTVNEQNRKTLLFPSTLKALDKGPYAEASLGVENIFKVFRIDAFWRLNYQLPREIDNFGFKFGFQLAL
ncbi:MAG: carboxypeptidase-like regulatory domain-containing protein [Bacteroidetes bacterium]|nr:carboxypeptidase-like regulatory domain-containing protein [Bacteroidota bacterium]